MTTSPSILLSTNPLLTTPTLPPLTSLYPTLARLQGNSLPLNILQPIGVGVLPLYPANSGRTSTPPRRSSSSPIFNFHSSTFASRSIHRSLSARPIALPSPQCHNRLVAGLGAPPAAGWCLITRADRGWGKLHEAGPNPPLPARPQRTRSCGARVGQKG